MKKKWLSIFLASAMLVSNTLVAFAADPSTDADGGTSPQPDAFVEKMADMYEEPEIEFWPQVRWWLAQGYHTDETLAEEAQSLYDNGFGAMEVLAMTANGVTPASRYSWGSAEWSSDMQVLIREATKQGLGMSLTSGTHWGTANLPNTFTFQDKTFDYNNPAASQVLSYGQSAAIADGERFSGAIPEAGVAPAPTVNNIATRDKRLVSVVAVKVASGTTLYAGDSIDLTDQVVLSDGSYTLDWTNNTGDERLILTYWQHGSAQTASPSVATNYAINYLDTLGLEAVKEYWETYIFTPEMQEVIDENGRIEFYMDSLELGQGTCNSGTLWSSDFEEEFKARRGYDIAPYLHILMCNMSSSWHTGKTYRFGTQEEDEDIISGVRNDYFQTLTELYSERTVKAFRDWLHTHNITLRIEPGYSSNFEVSLAGKEADHIENESWEFNTNPDSFRSLSGSAHLYGKVYSSETGAVSSNNGYRLPLDYYNQIIQQQFALGIQRTVMHGYSSAWGPESVTNWPGFGPSGINSFAVYMGSRNPYAHFGKDWSMWVARNQKALRQGNPRVDLGILRIEYNQNNRLEEGYAGNHQVPGLRHQEGIYWRDNGLQENGYTYEYFAPMNLEEEEVYFDEEAGVVVSDGPAYQALLIYQDMMPLSSAEVLLDWARKGLPVIIANDTEEIVGSDVGTTAANFGLKYDKAANKTPYHDGLDQELQLVMDELKALPNVIELNPDEPGVKLGAGSSQSKAPDALRSLGVYPRADYVTPNAKFITNMRETDDELYLYLYNYMYDAKYYTQGYTGANWGVNRPLPDTESFTTAISIDGLGKPYSLNTSSGEATPIDIYTFDFENGRTIVDVTLEPGESAMVVLDKNNTEDVLHAVYTTADKIVHGSDGTIYAAASEPGYYNTVLSDGKTVVTDIPAVPENIDLSGQWSLLLESWEAGERLYRTEDRDESFAPAEGAYTTTESTVPTVKNLIEVGELDSLVPWATLPDVENADRITGVGYYTTTVTLPDDWSGVNGAYLEIGSINQGSGAVYVNGERVPGGIDVCNPVTDISHFLTPGDNEIRVEVAAANLYNRQASPSGANIQHYGMTGETRLVTYTLAPLGDASGLLLSTDAFLVEAGDYANITTEFAETVDSNTAILNYTFDTERFTYADFHPDNDAVRVISKEATDTGAKVVVMIADYNTQTYGRLAIQAKPGAVLSTGRATVKADAEYVVRDGSGEKTINTAIGVVSFTTFGPGEDDEDNRLPRIKGDTNLDNVVDLIDLSNMIDWFGLDDSDARWNSWYTYFDFNNNGNIDIYDISYVAQLIK